MAQLYSILKPQNTYFDRKNYSSSEDYNAALAVSGTVYVGNLSFYTSQDSIRELFSMAGKVSQIIMGINDQGNPCGFCFVVFQTHQEASNAVQFISKTKLNDRIIRVDWDPGYKKGREKGRGYGGQQRREDFRAKEDAQRPRKKGHYQARDRERERNDRPQRTERERTRQKGQYADREWEGDRGRDRGRRQRQYPDRQERGKPEKVQSKRDQEDY